MGMRCPTPSLPHRDLNAKAGLPTTVCAPHPEGTTIPLRPRKFRVFTRSSLYSETASISEVATSTAISNNNIGERLGPRRAPSIQGDTYTAKHNGIWMNNDPRGTPRLPVLENVHQMAYLLDVIDNIPPSLAVLEPTRLRTPDSFNGMEDLD